jgi:hypothetical protein
MIRRLIILLLIVGCVFGDTIKWQDANAKGKTYDITNVEFQYIKYQRVYYLDYRGIKVIIECPKVVSITDSEGNNIDFDCADKPNSINEEETKIKISKLKQAGNHLVQFRKDYYTGFMVSMLGNVATLYGASENKSDIILYGGIASLLGGILMLISFDSAGEAGEDLIDAGEKLETEQESN